MKPIPYCVPHVLKMILDTAKAISDDEFIHRKVLMKVMAELTDEGDLGQDASEVYLLCWEIACRALGVKDPYETLKSRSTKTALGVLQTLEAKFSSEEPHDPMTTSIRTAYAGAMLDFSGLGRTDVLTRIVELYRQSPAIDDTSALIEAAAKSKSVLFVANRAGEVVLDRILANTLAQEGKEVRVVLTERPIFGMATEKDIQDAGFDPAISFVTPGTFSYGLAPEKSSTEFRQIFDSADLVIVKGHTHFATIARTRPMFFILRAATEEIAAELNIEVNSGAITRLG